DRNRSHWSTSKTPSYTKSVSWQHHPLSQAITNGFQRSMFSNEAGMGSTPNAAAAAASWPPHPAAQGIVQMIGIFIDTLVICTASAMLILL
ncbi:alanine:cation symporter family protein, partial [Shigella sonnei]|nr:alanine:cation symporter family protein [Shigella sonnei]